MTIHWNSRLLGAPVTDRDGHRLGRVTVVYCTPDHHTVVWFVLRLPGVRRRAVPGEGAHWNTSAGTGLWVPLRREQVLASPVVHVDSLDAARCRSEVEAFYTDRHGHADDGGGRSRPACVLIPRDTDVPPGGAHAQAPDPACSPTTTSAHRRVRRQRAVR